MKKIFQKKVTKKEKIDMIRKMAEVELPEIIRKCQDEPDNEPMRRYFDQRKIIMTMLIIEVAIGAKTEQKENGEWKYIFNGKLPDFSDINKICDIVEKYYESYEKPYIIQPTVADDMSIPKTEGTVEAFKIDKISKKALTSGIGDYINKYQMIDRAVIMSLAEYGQKLRKKQNLYTTLIIGAVVLVIAGAAVTGTIIYKKKHNGSSDDIDVDDVDVEVDDIDVEIEDVDVPMEQDVPVVEID